MRVSALFRAMAGSKSPARHFISVRSVLRNNIIGSLSRSFLVLCSVAHRSLRSFLYQAIFSSSRMIVCLTMCHQSINQTWMGGREKWECLGWLPGSISKERACTTNKMTLFRMFSRMSSCSLASISRWIHIFQWFFNIWVHIFSLINFCLLKS